MIDKKTSRLSPVFQINVTNSLSKNSGTLTFFAKMSGVNVPSGFQVTGFTNESSPYVNYTANNIDPNRFLATQVKELGNSLGTITGQVPGQINNTPNDPNNNEPGSTLLDCYNLKSGNGPVSQ